ncbi:MAG: protein kinase [Deltaproteobacteria bacterium]|nr:protein kinase [Deltaproteobacteria bacterium]
MMQSGNVIGDRFEIQRLAEVGGMATVYQGIDRFDGLRVAIKIMPTDKDKDGLSDRFIREARMLSELKHPAIVRYLAHGSMPSGERYLVMEWLEGEDLSRRLKRSGLSVNDTISLASRASGALGIAHRKGIIHRDIKPSNLFMIDGKPDQVKVLDFGVARLSDASRALTREGFIVGTLGFIAPEQARGETDVDERADIFSLGCVLFKCLTGRLPFVGEHPLAVLAKVVGEPTPRVGALWPDVPRQFDELVACMMDKDPKQRPASCQEVVNRLEEISVAVSKSAVADRVPITISQSRVGITGEEQSFLSVVLVSRDLLTSSDLSRTLPSKKRDRSLVPLREMIESFGGIVTPMAYGAVLGNFSETQGATDQATRAAICALALRKTAPEMKIALATGPAKVSGFWPIGPIIDRAAEMLKSGPVETEQILIDEVTTSLLDRRFEIDIKEGQRFLVREQEVSSEARRLLGRPTPFIGREREMAFLEGTLDECIEEQAAQAVLVIARNGAGKTRLQRELVRRVNRRDVADVLAARGDQVYAGSAFNIVAQLVRYATGIREGDSPDSQYAALKRHLEPLFEEPQRTRISEFLGELNQSPTTDDVSPALRAARNDPAIMSEQLRSAFCDWLGAMSARRPLLIIIEDLHWADLTILNFLETALKQLTNSPLMMLALARPAVLDAIPRLKNSEDFQILHLGNLKRRAAERLARAVLGKDTPEKTVQRIIDQAAGNALYLEELIRHVAQARESEFPVTMLAMVQSRVEDLPGEARRLLRAASVFGVMFWEGAAAHLLGSAMPRHDIADWLNTLIDQEFLEPSPSGKFMGERELVFRHALFREAAYAMLTEEDRALGHRLAAQWLEQAEEKDPLVVAEHWIKGREPARAIPYFIRAARSAFDAASLEAVLEITERGLVCGAENEQRGVLYLYSALRLLWITDLEGVYKPLSNALELIPKGTDDWFVALGAMCILGAFSESIEATGMALTTLLSYQGDVPPTGPAGNAGYLLSVSLMQIGQVDPALMLHQRLEQAAESSADYDPVFHGWLRMTRSNNAILGHAELGEAIPNAREAMQLFTESRANTARVQAEFMVGWAALVLGRLSDSEHYSGLALTNSQSAQMGMIACWSSYALGIARIFNGEIAVGIETLEPMLDEQTPLIISAYSRVGVALGHYLEGNLDDADREAQTAADASGLVFQIRAQALAVLSAVALQRSDQARAIELARMGLDPAQPLGGNPMFESLLRLTLAEALDASGEKQEARDVLSEAHQRLKKQLASLDGEDERESFLNNLPANARILELAKSRL